MTRREEIQARMPPRAEIQQIIEQCKKNRQNGRYPWLADKYDWEPPTCEPEDKKTSDYF
jgi:hypothetical protein